MLYSILGDRAAFVSHERFNMYPIYHFAQELTSGGGQTVLNDQAASEKSTVSGA
jgi:hypothetical protein